MDRLGVSPACIAVLKEEQALIVANLMRAASLQRIAFLPFAYTLVETILAGLVALLLFTRVTTEAPEAILFGFISLISLRLLRSLRPANLFFGVTSTDLAGIRL